SGINPEMAETTKKSTKIWSFRVIGMARRQGRERLRCDVDAGEGPLAGAQHVLARHRHVGLDVAHLLAVPRYAAVLDEAARFAVALGQPDLNDQRREVVLARRDRMQRHVLGEDVARVNLFLGLRRGLGRLFAMVL